MLVSTVMTACILVAASDWNSVPWQPANPIVGRGALVVHDDGSAVEAFSATTRRFDAIAPSGSPILGAGDFVAVVQEGGTKYRAFSARRGETASFTTNDPLDAALVGDDVAVLVFSTGGAKKTAWAYSAVTNVWQSLGYTPASAILADNVVVSRFVAIVRSTAGLHGFSARVGLWSTVVGIGATDPPQADGNVGIARIMGANTLEAFSGVTGVWAASPPMHASNVTQLAHNVVFVRVSSGASAWKASAFSAYDPRWVTSSVSRTNTAVAAIATDNVAFVSSAFPPDPSYEVIGARPHQSWAALTLSSPAYFTPGEDYAMVESLATKHAYAFSGLTSGAWTAGLPYTQFSGATFQSHQMVAIDDAGNLDYGYSPTTNAFAIDPQPIAYTVENQDAVFDLFEFSLGGQVIHAFSARWGKWILSPPLEPGATFTAASADSVIAEVQQTGAAANAIHVFDERCNLHAPAYQPGFPTTVIGGRNVLLAERTGATKEWRAYSVQRGDWSAPAGAATGAPLVAAQVEDDVAWLVDSAGQLHAFGAHGDLAAWYAWPNDTEYQTFGSLVGFSPASPLGMSFTGAAVETPLLLAALAPKCPGLHVGGFLNPLALDPGTLTFFGPFAAIGPTLTEPFVSTAGNAAPGAYLQVWLQGAFFGGPQNRLGVRCEGIWIF